MCDFGRCIAFGNSAQIPDETLSIYRIHKSAVRNIIAGVEPDNFKILDIDMVGSIY